MAILFLICCSLAIGGACLGTLGMASDRTLDSTPRPALLHRRARRHARRLHHPAGDAMKMLYLRQPDRRPTAFAPQHRWLMAEWLLHHSRIRVFAIVIPPIRHIAGWDFRGEMS